MRYKAIIIVLLLILSYFIYDKITTRPTIIYQEQKQVAVEKLPVTEVSKENLDCMIAAENFFDKKRAENIDYYSSSWNQYYEKSSGICFVGISSGAEMNFNDDTSTKSGIIYNVNNGDTYRLVDYVFIKINK